MTFSKHQIDQIKAFIGNQPMVDAVLAVLTPERDEALETNIDLDDAQYGRLVKARVIATTILNERVVVLRRIASNNPQPAPKNEAR